MCEVWFIRHGQSEENAGIQTPDHKNVQLTEMGRKQASFIAPHFELKQKPSLIVSSPYQRAQETARIVCDQIAGAPGYKMWPVEEFSFIAPRFWGGLLANEREKIIQRFWDNCDPHQVIPPNTEDAETFSVFIERVRATIKRIEALEEDFVVIFTHGYFIRAMFLHLMYPTPFDAQPLEEQMRQMCHLNYVLEKLPNCSVLKTFHEGGKVTLHPFDVTHLPPELITY